MAINDLALRLQSKFRNVPNVTIDDCTDWATDAVAVHGNDTDTVAVITLAQSYGARSIALNVAHFFSYTDGDESVDKTMLADQYLRLASDFQTAYDRIKNVTGTGTGATFAVIKRADR